MKWPSIDCKYLNIMIIDFPLKVLSIQDQQTTNELAHELQLCIPNTRWVCPSVQSCQSLPSACSTKMMVESAYQCSLARAFPVLAHTRWWLSLPISAVLPEPSQCLPTQDDGWVCPSVQSCQSLPSACPHKMIVESAHQCSLARAFQVLAHTRWWLSLPISAVLPEPSQSLPSACPHKMMVESAHQCSLARAFPVLAHTRWWLSLPISAVLPEPSKCLPTQDDGWVCPSVQSC